MIASRSARPALLGAILITVGGLAWLYWLPPSAKAALGAAAALNILVVLIFALTVVVFVLLYLGPYRNPGWLSPGFAGSLCLFGIAAFSTGEFIREAVRKPFVVYNVVLGNQVLPEQVLRLRKTGYLDSGLWTKRFRRARTIRGRSSTGGSTATACWLCRPRIASPWARSSSNTTATIATRRPRATRPSGRCCKGGRANWSSPGSSTSMRSSSCRPGAARRRRPSC